MAQVKTFSWTNPAAAVAKDFDVGFTVAEATSVDTTNGGSWYWNKEMADAAVLDVDSGAFATSNGFTPLSESANYGASVSAFTNANPGVITVDDAVVAGFAAGDTIKVEGIAESGSGSSLNQASTFTIASVTATQITLDQNTSAYNTYVSGGKVSRVSDSNGDAIALQNFARRGITLGTTPVGANNAAMVLVVRGDESVT